MTSTSKTPITIFWFRRDLRLRDNAGLYHALKESEHPVLPLFIFDRNILDQLPDPDDARVTFIHHVLHKMNAELQALGSSLITKFDTPLNAFKQLTTEYNIAAVYLNTDYEPYARDRDQDVEQLLKEKGIAFRAYKDHVVFEKDEVVKADSKPYTVFTPYKRAWLDQLAKGSIKEYPGENYFARFLKIPPEKLPSLEELGFTRNDLKFPDGEYRSVIDHYNKTRDFPALRGTTRIGIHLRFGTLSIRAVLNDALKTEDKTWLSELIWRDFYAMILWHFPWTVNQAFKADYDRIQWRNNEQEFEAWCQGRTGYPIVDAGMRELNATGFMHNRVRMITASFLTKHLLIDWRWGESYFAQKLLDYDQASNVGGWQWAAGSGNDAAPYFRIFNPELQTKKFDPELKYIKKWVPEFQDPFHYPAPIVEHKFARERVLKAFKDALQAVT
ncbi:MAG TPA: deoxyribodipyrimidine photo-lyase [Sphingobacteriaceae bacterium]